MRMFTCSWILGLAIALTASVDAGSVRFVDDDAPLGGDGASWDTAYRYLQDALFDAGAGGVTELRVAQGTYAPDQDEGGHVTAGDREATFQLVSDLAVRGGYAGVTSPADPDARDVNMYVTILTGDLQSGERSYHVSASLLVQGAVLDGLTITRGNADDNGINGEGGALRSVESEITLLNCRFVTNMAEHDGGAIYAASSELMMARCSFVDNFAEDSGGGIYLNGGKGIWWNCDFSDNYIIDFDGAAAAVISADLFLGGCTFTGNEIYQGSASEGGALYCEQSTVEVQDCSFVDNSLFQGNGGALAAKGGTLEVSDSEFIGGSMSDGNGAAIYLADNVKVTICASNFTDNVSADGGGAIYGWLIASVSIEDCVFDGNIAGDGSGGAIAGRYLDIGGCTFRSNLSKYGGGGGAIKNYSGISVVRDCYFAQNIVHTSLDTDSGGGAIQNLGDLTLINCLIAQNTTDDENGGAIDNSGQLSMVNCTIVGNSTDDGLCGGVYSTGSLNLSNCILWSNADDAAIDESTQIMNDGGAVDLNYNCIQGLTGGLGGVGNISEDPLFVDSDADDLRLLPGSPCIDAADNAAMPEGIFTDLDGNPRFVDDPNTTDTGNGTPPIVDMGAYEFQIAACLADVTGSDGIVDAADLAIILGNWGPVPPNDPIADLTGDGAVGADDLAIVLGNWGPC